jgi:putative lipoic acid-binding regulatory protein
VSAAGRETLIEFPCDFPIKIMGARVAGFAQAVVAVVLAHDPGFDPATVEMRPSRKGNYLALTCTVRATSQAQLDALYRDLSGHPMVKVVL